MPTALWKWRWSHLTREQANIPWALPQATPPYDSFKSCFLTSINLLTASALIHKKLAAVVVASYSGVVSTYFAHEVTACIPRTYLIIQGTEHQKYSVRKHSPTVK